MDVDNHHVNLVVPGLAVILCHHVSFDISYFKLRFEKIKHASYSRLLDDKTLRAQMLSIKMLQTSSK